MHLKFHALSSNLLFLKKNHYLLGFRTNEHMTAFIYACKTSRNQFNASMPFASTFPDPGNRLNNIFINFTIKTLNTNFLLRLMNY